MRKWFFAILCLLMLTFGFTLNVSADGNFQIENGVLIGYFGPNTAVDLVIPNDVKAIGRNAFDGYTAIKSVSIPATVTKIDMNAFKDCKGLTSITIPGNVEFIGACAFSGCTGLTSISIPDSVKTMMDRAFDGCSGLTTAKISFGMDVIRWGTFRNCTRLESIIIPAGVTAIKGYCFYGDTKLTDIYYGGTKAQWEAIEKADPVYGYENGLAGVNPTIHYSSVSIPRKVKSVSLKPTTLKIFEGNSYKLTATVKPSDADNKTITWKTSNKKVATVDANGTVHAIAKGTATITVTTADGKKTAKCKVTVDGPTHIKSISLNKKTVTIDLNKKTKSLSLKVTYNPSKVTDKTISFTSSNPAVASVSYKGSGAKATVYAHAEGKATIKVTSADGGKKATCKITVKDTGLVKGLNLNKKKADVKVNKTLKLKATLKPSKPRNKVIYWSSSDESVATVNQKGEVKGISRGTAVITAVTAEGGFTKTCKVTVK
ncbi:MAG: Ig-like domain-containing protein [Lachnospiraceae bacterium]|nr:Ig-like domain-containing protein [Lachnospiraceae bacterium]